MEKGKSTSNYDLKKLASELVIMGHGQEMLNILADLLMIEQSKKTLYTLYLGLEAELDETLRHEIANVVSKYTDSFTIIEATGYFQNNSEYTQLIQIGAENRKVAYECAEALRSHFDQLGVGIVETGQYKRVIRDKFDPPVFSNTQKHPDRHL